MTRKRKIIKAHTLTPDEAMDLLHNHVQFSADDSGKVEMPMADLMAKFDISYPLNILNRDGRVIANGFSRLTSPPSVNFYLRSLAKVVGISEETAREIVKENNVAMSFSHVGFLAATKNETPILSR